MILSKHQSLFMEGVHLSHSQVLVPEGNALYRKILSKLYSNSNGKSIG